MTACATYHPEPLSPGAVDRALTVPSASILTQEASELHHPLLGRVTLDPTRPLSPEEAAVLAVLVNPGLRAQRDRLGVSSAQLVSAGLLPNPVLNANVGILTGGPGTTTSFGIGPTWQATSLITHEIKVQAARASLAQVRLDVAWAEWQTAETAKGAVYAVVALEGEAQQARDIDRRLADNLRVIQSAYDRHDSTVLQLSAARTASDAAHSTALALEQQVQQQRMSLLRALGLPPGTAVALREDIRLSDTLTLPPANALLRGLADRRLDLIALQRGYASQELRVRQAILAQFPRIDLGVSRAEDNTGVYSVGPSATIVLPVFNRNQGAIALERATRKRLYDEYVDRVRLARTDIAGLLNDIATLTPQIAAAQAALAPLRQLVDTYRIAVNRGSADVLSYYSAWNSLDQKQIALLRLKQQLEADRIALELAAGEPLPQPKSPPSSDASAGSPP